MRFSPGCSCCGGVACASCGSTPVPATLYATFTYVSGPTCDVLGGAAGVVVPLTSGPSWGYREPLGENHLFLQFRCTAVADEFLMVAVIEDQFGNAVCAIGFIINDPETTASGTCDPLYVDFGNLFVGGGSSDCGGECPGSTALNRPVYRLEVSE